MAPSHQRLYKRWKLGEFERIGRCRDRKMKIVKLCS